MRTAETILAVLSERGRRGLPLERVYRLLYNRELYLLAYGRLYRNEGALTRGATSETVDGMSLAKIEALIERVRYERFRWTPVRRTYIDKKHSMKKRALGIPVWSAYCTPYHRLWEYSFWVGEIPHPPSIRQID